MDWEERVRMEEEFKALLADNEKMRKQLFLASKCELCCASDGQAREMMGGRVSRMCLDHWNLWHKYAVDHPEWDAIVEAKARMDVTENLNEEDHVIYVKKYTKITRDWFGVSEQWIKDNTLE